MADPSDGAFAHVGDDELYAGERLRLVRARFRAPDGEEFGRDVVRNMGAVAVVPLLDDRAHVLLVRLYRGPVDRELLEVPAGLLDVEGESLEGCARRELAEEVGRDAATFERLLTTEVAPGFSDHTVTVFLATGLTEVDHDRQGPEERGMTVEVVGLADVPALVRSGAISDAKTIVALSATRAELGLGG